MFERIVCFKQCGAQGFYFLSTIHSDIGRYQSEMEKANENTESNEKRKWTITKRILFTCIK